MNRLQERMIQERQNDSIYFFYQHEISLRTGQSKDNYSNIQFFNTCKA